MSMLRSRNIRSFRLQADKRRRRNAGRRGRRLLYESLEPRELLAVVALEDLSVSQSTGEKPMSKLWEHAGQWWTVMPNNDGAWVHRLDGTGWTPTVKISTNKSVKADVKSTGDMAHVLLLNGSSAQLASLQYDAVDNRFEPWSLRPEVANVPLNKSIGAATIDIDSTGRMWVAYDVKSTIEVRYSDGLYSDWSSAITVASGITSHDLCVITAMPDNSIGVLWSNQNAKRFGFRRHVDTAAPDEWLTAEVPAAQSATGKMADDHVNVAVASNGTLYAAIKTSYNSPRVNLLVRRPEGTWDPMYAVDSKGTRPIVLVNEAANQLIVAFTSKTGGGDILYRASPLDTISLGPTQVMFGGGVNNVTSTKQNFTENVVLLAATGSTAKGAMFSFDAIVTNEAPLVNAGADQSLPFGSPVSLDGTVSDDGQPAPAALAINWSVVSGPGIVSFGNAAAADTTATFSVDGQYVLRLTANDGQRSAVDDVVVTITPEEIVDPQLPPKNEDQGSSETPPPPPPPDNPNPGQIAFQDGVFPSVAYAGTSDTKLTSRSQNNNYGNASTLNVDGKPDESALFRWDISAIPTGSTVVSAAIELFATSGTNGDYEVYALQQAWDEVSATWKQYASGSNWDAVGADGAGDHGSAELGQFAPASKGIYRITLNDAGIAVVQAWIENASANYGIILKDYGVSHGVGVSSSEAKNTSQRPKLLIDYIPPRNAAVDAAFGAFVNSHANGAPSVEVGPNLTVRLGQSLNLSGAVSDDGLPHSPGLLTVLWSRVTGPGTVTFADSASASTSAQFSAAGSYVLRLTVSDGELESFDELTVTVTEPVSSTPVTTTKISGGTMITRRGRR